MARIRTIKPTHWADKELAKITLQAHLLWIALWNFSDDEGVFEGDVLLIKSQVFPRRTDIRTEQIQSWLDQLVKARFIIPFTHKNEGYYLHRTFKAHQRIDKPQPSLIPNNVINAVLEHSTNVLGTVPSVEYSNSIGKVKGVVGGADALTTEKNPDQSKPPDPNPPPVAPPPSLKKWEQAWQDLECPFGEESKNLWADLCGTSKWKRKELTALKASLKQLMVFDEVFARMLMHKAIAGNYQGVVFQNTESDYFTWLKNKNGTNGTHKQTPTGAVIESGKRDYGRP